jgi:hypothetical protein
MNFGPARAREREKRGRKKIKEKVRQTLIILLENGRGQKFNPNYEIEATFFF